MVWKIIFKNNKLWGYLFNMKLPQMVSKIDTRGTVHPHTHKNDLKILKQKLVDLLHVLNISALNFYSALAKVQKQTNQNLLIPKAW